MSKSKLLVFSAIFVLSACSAVNQSATTEYLDLVGDKKAVEKYWVTERKVAPDYPEYAGKNAISGCVEFTLLINEEGKPQNITVSKSFPGATFNKQAYEALRKWQWEPSSDNTQRQPVLTTVQLDFVTPKSVNYDDAYKACKI